MEWTPLIAFAVYMIISTLGDVVSIKTRGIFPSLIVIVILYVIGFWTGIIPVDQFDKHGFVAMTGGFVLALIVLNLGTQMDLKVFIKEWKTVVIALAGIAGMAALLMTIGSVIIGKAYAWSGAAVLTGGLVSAIIVDGAAQAAGQPIYGGFAYLISAAQLLFGMPICSVILARYVRRNEPEKLVATGEGKNFNIRFLPKVPEKYNTPAFILLRLALLAIVCKYLSDWTGLNMYVWCLILGVLFHAFGFLETQSLVKAKGIGFMTLVLLMTVPNGFTSVTPAVFLDFIIPLLVTAVVGIVGVLIMCVLIGKLLKYPATISFCIGMTATLGYPTTQILVDEIVRGYEGTAEQKQMISDYLLPKMLIGGFTTVSVGSVIFAGVIAPYIFS